MSGSRDNQYVSRGNETLSVVSTKVVLVQAGAIAYSGTTYSKGQNKTKDQS